MGVQSPSTLPTLRLSIGAQEGAVCSIGEFLSTPSIRNPWKMEISSAENVGGKEVLQW